MFILVLTSDITSWIVKIIHCYGGGHEFFLTAKESLYILKDY